ncbi:MAG: gfo/Idh/MocA family oxidoreductase, partial [Candidatus Hydrogenedentes bacterium]|nr:gfo/Idh/MocA family oxidoreductase [Candidatus Hydrogenedentota bacterium]
NWIRACKGEGEACSNFDYSGPFTEMVLLGNLAIRTGRKMDYDAKAGKITNDAEANAMLTKPYRAGFDLPL